MKKDSKTSSSKTTNTREKDRQLETLMRSTGHLLPVTPAQVQAFEKLGIHHDLPAGSGNADAILKKISKE